MQLKCIPSNRQNEKASYYFYRTPRYLGGLEWYMADKNWMNVRLKPVTLFKICSQHYSCMKWTAHGRSCLSKGCIAHFIIDIFMHCGKINKVDIEVYKVVKLLVYCKAKFDPYFPKTVTNF